MFKKKPININFNIKSRVIKLISEDSKYIGYCKFSDAIKKAKEKNVDLVELNNNFKGVSICKLIKYGKLLYLEKKKLLKIKKKKIELDLKKKKKIKEIKFSLFISNDDLNNKLNNIKRLLGKTFNVRVLLVIRGKEIYKKNIINDLCLNIIKKLENFGKLMKFPNTNVKNIYMYFISNVKIKK